MGSIEKSEEAIKRLDESIQRLATLPQTYVYITIFQAVQILHVMKEYDLCTYICDGIVKRLSD